MLYSRQHHFQKFITVLIFAFYSIAVFSVAGIPTVYTLRTDLVFNLIPLTDIVNSPVEYMKNTLLNIILFTPMGFLLPAIWREFRSLKKTILVGFAVSIFIEVLQIFTFRLTDIDDLITNTLGTFFGYDIGKMISFKLPLIIPENDKNISIKYEPVVIFVITFLIGFFLKPLVSDVIWEIVLSGSLWERIKGMA